VGTGIPKLKMSSSSAVVIVGAGHAGVQAAASLPEQGFQDEIVLLSDESELL
jgi:3-phenylpropionate/trans-cinnamate dioxygenase ferredoxin reductase subunit